MSRIGLLLPSTLLLAGCVAPGLKYIQSLPMTTTTGDSSTGDDASTTLITTTDDASEGDGESASEGTTTMTASTGSTSGGIDPTTTTTGATHPVCGDGVVECDDAKDIAVDRCHDCTKDR